MSLCCRCNARWQAPFLLSALWCTVCRICSLWREVNAVGMEIRSRHATSIRQSLSEVDGIVVLQKFGKSICGNIGLTSSDNRSSSSWLVCSLSGSFDTRTVGFFADQKCLDRWKRNNNSQRDTRTVKARSQDCKISPLITRNPFTVQAVRTDLLLACKGRTAPWAPWPCEGRSFQNKWQCLDVL